MYFHVYVFFDVGYCNTKVHLEEEKSGMPNMSVIAVGS